MTIHCLFAQGKTEKYIVDAQGVRIGFRHLCELTAYLDQRYGKENYRMRFDYL
jgi:glycerol-3-phosphate O-acyltransferase